MTPPSGSRDKNPTAPPSSVAARSSHGFVHTVRGLLRSREFSVVLVLMLLCSWMPFTKAHDTFFKHANAENIMRNVSLLLAFAVGETVVIITGGIDLSLGSLIAFSGMVLALVLTKLSVTMLMGPAIALAIVITLLVSLAIGGIHASLIHFLRLPPFVVTLASLLMLRSQSYLMNRQQPIPLQDYPWLIGLTKDNIFEGTSFAIPKSVLIVAVVAVLVGLILNKARVGRYLYSVGSNEQATGLSGVNVYKVKLFAYGLSGLLGGLAGVLVASYNGQGDPACGQAYELDAVAAAVVGGASLTGGQGSVAGTVLGATLLYTILSAINLTLDTPDPWRGTVVGGVLLFAVLVTAIQQRRQNRA